MAIRRYFTAGLGALVLPLALAAPAPATIISLDLSSHSSEPGIDPALLAATMDFSVSGSVLTLTVTNNTSGLNEFSINRIYFNANAAVGTLMSSSTGQFDVNAISGNADGFGMFDFVLSHGPDQGHNHHVIQPGMSETFTFTFSGSGFTEKAFTTELSAQFDSNLLAIVAAKFVMGPGDNSAFGAHVPAPGVLVLLGLAGIISGRRRRRRA